MIKPIFLLISAFFATSSLWARDLADMKLEGRRAEEALVIIGAEPLMPMVAARSLLWEVPEDLYNEDDYVLEHQRGYYTPDLSDEELGCDNLDDFEESEDCDFYELYQESHSEQEALMSEHNYPYVEDEVLSFDHRKFKEMRELQRIRDNKYKNLKLSGTQVSLHVAQRRSHENKKLRWSLRKFRKDYAKKLIQAPIVYDLKNEPAKISRAPSNSQLSRPASDRLGQNNRQQAPKILAKGVALKKSHRKKHKKYEIVSSENPYPSIVISFWLHRFLASRINHKTDYRK